MTIPDWLKLVIVAVGCVLLLLPAVSEWRKK